VSFHALAQQVKRKAEAAAAKAEAEALAAAPPPDKNTQNVIMLLILCFLGLLTAVVGGYYSAMKGNLDVAEAQFAAEEIPQPDAAVSTATPAGAAPALSAAAGKP